MEYAQKWADRISGEFVSKYTVFSHKGGVRILADKSAKDKPPSVVGVSRLTLLDCLTTWVYLDNTRTRMRVLFYMVICASFYLDFRLFKVRSLRSRGGEIPEFASRVLAYFDYQNNSQHIHTAPCGATSAFADAFYVHYSRMLFGYSCEKHPFV